jgi:hypothetical protein
VFLTYPGDADAGLGRVFTEDQGIAEFGDLEDLERGLVTVQGRETRFVSGSVRSSSGPLGVLVKQPDSTVLFVDLCAPGASPMMALFVSEVHDTDAVTLRAQVEGFLRGLRVWDRGGQATPPEEAR